MSLQAVGAPTPARPPGASAGAARLLTAILVAAVFCKPGFAAESADIAGLTLAAALDAAEVRSAALQAQDASIRAAREMAVAAARLPDPELGFSIDNLPIEGPNRFSLDAEAMTMRSVSLRQRYTDADKRDAQRSRFEREADAAGAARVVQLTNLRTRTARAWFDRYYRERILDLLQRQREMAERTAVAVEAAYRGNRVAQEQVFIARTAVARIDERLHQARADLDNARSTLLRWVGEPARQPLAGTPRIDRTRLPSHALVHDLARHPDIALLDARERLAMAEAAVARAEKDADWTWSVKWGLRDEPFGDMLSVGVTIPLQWNQADRQDRELAARLEQAARVRAEREELRREHQADTERSINNWRANLARLEDYDRSLMPLAEDRTRAAEAAFRAGKGSLAAAVDARRMEIDTRTERLRIERETAFLWAELEYLVVDAALPAASPATESNEEPQQ